MTSEYTCDGLLCETYVDDGDGHYPEDGSGDRLCALCFQRFVDSQAVKPRYAELIPLDHTCDFGRCASRAVTVAVTTFVDQRLAPTGIVEVRGVCEAHVRDIPATVEVAR